MKIKNRFSRLKSETQENQRFSVNWEISKKFPVSQKSLCDFLGSQKNKVFLVILINKMSEIFHQFLTGGWKPSTFGIWKISDHAQKPLNVYLHTKTFHPSLMGGF